MVDLQELAEVVREVEEAERKVANLDGQIHSDLTRLGMGVEEAEAEVEALKEERVQKEAELAEAYDDLLAEYYAADTDQSNEGGSR